ncbi:MAG: 16S rRNA (adenine(1518)-N(6)/adenine(1519)-N(6))-dimethyltransferase RsmA [Betaproteobacteria bacterium]|nr:16S rRNA (adenine(1518)-N(6)/adenine(1519)-N(6))-dimethyltransferase RsmA [Betaproteobacteria bacterium]
MRHIPRKRFGQNFLTDQAVIDAIVTTVDPRPDDRMVEIGPGLGALTRPLAARLRHLHVVEIDRDLAAHLTREFGPQGVTVHQGDVLEFDFSRFGPGLRIVGNLPYNISTPVLFVLVRVATLLRDIHVMLQKEVVDRMAARPGSSAYGRLSVMLQYRFQIDRVLEVPASAFHPAPRVASAVARLSPLAPRDPARDEALFARIVTGAFSQRRKTLRNTLKPFLKDADFETLQIDPRARAQELAVADFVRITNHVEPDPTAE